MMHGGWTHRSKLELPTARLLRSAVNSAVIETTNINPEQWVEEHGDSLFRYAIVRVRDRATAEDLVQETFLAAIKSRERYDPRYAVRAWLIGILRHKVVDHLRKASREIAVEDEDLQLGAEGFSMKAFGIPSYRPPKWHINPRKVYEQKEFWDVFSGCLSRLDARLKTIFSLKELEGVSSEEICKEVGIKPNHLWVLLHRARAKLKTCLEENWLKQHREV
jgi:RNA polymerase sigma-70 factor (ECF subfamily)